MLATIVSHFDKQKNILTSPKSDKFTYKSVDISDLTSLYHTLATNYIKEYIIKFFRIKSIKIWI